MSQPKSSEPVPTPRFLRVVFGSVAVVDLWEALDYFLAGEKVYAVARFVSAAVWSLLAVLKVEWTQRRPWLRWLGGGLFIMYLALVVVAKLQR